MVLKRWKNRRDHSNRRLVHNHHNDGNLPVSNQKSAIITITATINVSFLSLALMIIQANCQQSQPVITLDWNNFCRHCYFCLFLGTANFLFCFIVFIPSACNVIITSLITLYIVCNR